MPRRRGRAQTLHACNTEHGPAEVPRRMDLVRTPVVESAGWRSAPGSGVPSGARSRTSSGSFASTGRAPPSRAARHRRRRRRRGHRAGGVPGRRPQPRPLRPPPAVRPVAAPDRGQPRDRLDACPPAARRGRSSATTSPLHPAAEPDGDAFARIGELPRRASRGGRAPLPARVHAGRDRRAARAAARHRQLAAPPRPRSDET